MRTTIMKVDIDKFYENIKNIQDYVGNKKIIPVIKANAYGTYINKNTEIIKKFDIVAVALTSEAIDLRKKGYEKEILVINQPCQEDIPDIIKHNVTVGLSDKYFLDKLVETNKEIKVHLEIETGMNRTGINMDDISYFVEKIKGTNIIVEGVYTHFSSADIDKEYTDKQTQKFKKAVDLIKDNFVLKYIHTSASNGLTHYDDEISNAVRPGMILYGYESSKGIKDKIPIKPICTLQTKISFIKEIEAGEKVGYGQTYTAKDKIIVATIPIGYADGLRRELSNKGHVVINNIKVPIIGRICMDSCMIDVSSIENVKIGDDVYIWDNNIQTLEDIASDCNTINYEILSTISYRVPRIHLR